MKICSICETPKEFSEYYTSKVSGIFPNCKKCYNKRRRDKYATDDEYRDKEKKRSVKKYWSDELYRKAVQQSSRASSRRYYREWKKRKESK